MKKSYIDLHMHSCYSDDGEFTPIQLVDMCYAEEIKIMAIADHNCVKANDEAICHARKLNIKYIPAIEIDCTYQGINLHVLGYGIDYHQPLFNQLGENIEKQELSCSLKKLELTNNMGFELTQEQLDVLSKNGVYTGEMFGEALLNDKRYLHNDLLKPYRKGGDRSDNPYVNFYWDYYAQGKPCYTEINLPKLETIIQLIHDYGGIAVLAHPGNNLKGHFELLNDIVKLGIDGVEAYSSYHSKEINDYFYNKVKELNILYTCGSDFHGKTKPAISLGENNCVYPQQIEEFLKANQLIMEDE